MRFFKIALSVFILFISFQVKAQVSVNVNIGSPPPWGPVGYTEVRYYYLPDVEAYYDIQTSMFIYYGNGVWIHRGHLPGHSAHYDLYSGYKVVMTDYHGLEPQIHFKNHKVKYAKGYKGGSQKTIGDNPGHNNQAKQQKQGKEQNSGGNYKTIENSSGHPKKDNSDGQQPAKNKGGGHGNGKKK